MKYWRKRDEERENERVRQNNSAIPLAAGCAQRGKPQKRNTAGPHGVKRKGREEKRREKGEEKEKQEGRREEKKLTNRICERLRNVRAEQNYTAHPAVAV